jgi:hypothetical protein
MALVVRSQINNGGKSGAKHGQSRAIRAVCRAAGSDFHRLLDFSSLIPTNSTAIATFYHFVPHLISKSLIVKQELEGRCSTPALNSENTKPCG